MEKRLTTEHIKQWNEGVYHKAFTILGAHVTDGGTFFAVWAPHAHSVSVVGEFNNWDGRENPMKKEDATNIELILKLHSLKYFIKLEKNKSLKMKGLLKDTNKLLKQI